MSVRTQEPGARLRAGLRVFCFFLLLLAAGRTALADCRLLADLAPAGAYGMADGSGQPTHGCRLDRPMVPASIIKIATVVAALRILGPEYRFPTQFSVDDGDNLYIRGFGDPTLTSEAVAVMAVRLRQLGLTRVRTLFVDGSAFALSGLTPGQAGSDNPYDAPVGPLSVNFNAVPLERHPSGRITPGEAQTPFLPIMAQMGRTRPAGRHRLNVCAGGCDPAERVARYSGELFRAQLEAAGVPVAALGGLRPTPAGARPLATLHSAQTLTAMSRSLLHYSTNFTANLVFLACGAERFGFPATWDKARRAVAESLGSQLGASAKAIVQVDGAGLSRDNRVTARAMLGLLEVFRPHRDLLPRDRHGWIKTGTLTGVANGAGYFADGRAYVLFLNQPASRRAMLIDRLSRLPSTTGPTVPRDS